jgi:hypothetical protein
MSQGLESAVPQAQPNGSNVVPLGHAGIETAASCCFSLAARLTGYGAGRVQDGSEQWFQSFLAQLRPGESLSLRLALEDGSGLAFGATVCAPPAAMEARVRELEGALREVVASAAPHFKLAADRTAPARDLPHQVELWPAGQRVCLDDLLSQGPRPVAGAKAVPGNDTHLALRLAHAPERRPDLAAVAELLRRPAMQGAVLDLHLSAFGLDARHRRALQDFLKGLVGHLARVGAQGAPLVLLNDRVLQQLKAWSTTSRGLRVAARLFSPTPPPGAMLDMLCQALFGATRRTESEEAEVDLTAAWPDLDLAFLARLATIPATKVRLDARRVASTTVGGSQGIALGRLDDDASFVIDGNARKQHVYMIGGTGTGKSTLMLNMIAQDMKAGRGVIVIDPHGDLWEKALQLVPSKRLDDLVLVHPTDARGAFTMNVLERLGDDVEGEHGRMIGELLDFLKRSQWKEVPEAFGPMFENYFRNGLQLLLSAEGDDASILDFQRVFSDDSYRSKLLEKCKNREVAQFWRNIVEEAQYEAKLSNHAPYIVCKMAPITGNAHLKRILGANRSTLDFGKVIASQQICLINLAQPYLAKEASRFLGGMITSRLVASAKATQAKVADVERKRVNVYMDEFQTYISAGLADGLAEVRKYGLNLVLANQSLSQLQADRYQAEVAEAVLSNAANVIAFRVGIADAARLGRRFEPELPSDRLAKLPNYHAAALVVRGSEISTPEVFSTLPEPKPPRRRKAVEQPCAVDSGRLADIRGRILGLIGARGAGSHPTP